MANANTIGKVLAEIVLCGFPKFEPTKETTRVWIAYLSDIDDDLLVAGLRHHISTSGSAFAPSIPEIRTACAVVKARITGLPTAYEAWEDLLKAKSGVLVSVNDENEIMRAEYKFIHPLVKVVAQQLGWPTSFIGDNVMADRAHFFKAWDVAAARYLEDESEMPEVTQYIGSRRNGKALPVGSLIKQLDVKHD
jgi:hypothetical protein